MVFSSLIFIFLFLVSNLITQAVITDTRKKNIVMLSFSMVFYAWTGLQYLVLLLGMTFLCWYSALMISDARGLRPEEHRLFIVVAGLALCLFGLLYDGFLVLGITIIVWHFALLWFRDSKKSVLVVCTAAVLALLGYFKYFGFFQQILQSLTGYPTEIKQVAMVIGISFYTFQLLSYVIDVYRGDAKVQQKYWLLLLYASLFHQCVAGPIVRYRDVNDDILHRRVKMTELSRGITRFAVGLAKKAILANGCSAIEKLAIGLEAKDEITVAALENASVTGLWLLVFAYTLFIYLDFSAYSDMAIGMGLMCGFHYKENFNYPYMADSVTDFWRRWHISLSTFFRDYVYIPLGGNRCSKGRHVFNLFVVWALTGMWHGASWNFILWGLYYFVFLLIEKYLVDVERIPRGLRRALTLLIVCFGWAIFKFDGAGMLGTGLKGMFGLNGNSFRSDAAADALKYNVYFLIFCILAVTPLGKSIGNLVKNMGRRSVAWMHVYNVLDAAYPVLLLLLASAALAGDSYNPFAYFKF